MSLKYAISGLFFWLVVSPAHADGPWDDSQPAVFTCTAEIDETPVIGMNTTHCASDFLLPVNLSSCQAACNRNYQQRGNRCRRMADRRAAAVCWAAISAPFAACMGRCRSRFGGRGGGSGGSSW